MRKLTELDAFRHRSRERSFGVEGDDHGGMFVIPSPDVPGVDLRVIAGNGLGWDHLSISTSAQRTATWAEMEHIKRLFFKPTEVAFQLHMPPKDHISHHPFVLHIWRNHAADPPLPPRIMV